MHIKNHSIVYGFNSITEMNGKNSDMMINFGILKMKDNDTWKDDSKDLERAVLLITGEVIIKWGAEQKLIKRLSCFDESPLCLHVCKGVNIEVYSKSESELAIVSADNDSQFESKLYEYCISEEFGKGTLGETSTRIVRTIFDFNNAPHSNLVIGEVINFPGKWSSYPPHHHPQPEVYFYKFMPENGYGHSEEGDSVYKVFQNDSVAITPGLTHSQCAAPGYAMYYCWMIRNLKDNPFRERIFEEEHAWVIDLKSKIWPYK